MKRREFIRGLAGLLALNACGGSRTVRVEQIDAELPADSRLQPDTQTDLGAQVDVLAQESKPKINQSYECGSLADYPTAFNNQRKFDGYFVVGEAARPLDNLSMTDIATSMTTKEGRIIEVKDAAKLDSEVYDVGAQNLIVIGNPCYNRVTAELLNTVYGNGALNQDCLEEFEPRTAKVLMLKNKETGNLAMIMAGYDVEETRMAAKVIAHRPEELSGCKVEIIGTDYSDAKIKKIK